MWCKDDVMLIQEIPKNLPQIIYLEFKKLTENNKKQKNQEVSVGDGMMENPGNFNRTAKVWALYIGWWRKWYIFYCLIVYMCIFVTTKSFINVNHLNYMIMYPSPNHKLFQLGTSLIFSCKCNLFSTWLLTLGTMLNARGAYQL